MDVGLDAISRWANDRHLAWQSSEIAFYAVKRADQVWIRYGSMLYPDGTPNGTPNGVVTRRNSHAFGGPGTVTGPYIYPSQDPRYLECSTMARVGSGLGLMTP